MLKFTRMALRMIESLTVSAVTSQSRKPFSAKYLLMISEVVFSTYSENSRPGRRLTLSCMSFLSPEVTPVKLQRETLGRSLILMLNHAESPATLRLSTVSDTSSKYLWSQSLSTTLDRASPGTVTSIPGCIPVREMICWSE